MKLKKTVVVTGASSGIGLSIANIYVNNGYQVVGLDKNIGQNIVPFDVIKCDISREHEVVTNFNIIKERYTKIDYLVNCAGIFFDHKRTLIENLDIEEVNMVILNNLIGLMLTTREALPLLKLASGDRAIVNIASDQVEHPKMKNSSYIASKGGVLSFSRACAKEFINYGIRVNVVEPASVQTNFIEKLTSSIEEKEEIYRRENDKMPLGIIDADDIANIAYFLGSEQSRKITGQSILVDSGLYI